MTHEILEGMLAQTEEAICLGKQAHMSERAATDESTRLRRKLGHQNISAYRCQFCLLWHVGHTPTPQRRKGEMMIQKYRGAALNERSSS